MAAPSLLTNPSTKAGSLTQKSTLPRGVVEPQVSRGHGAGTPRRERAVPQARTQPGGGFDRQILQFPRRRSHPTLPQAESPPSHQMIAARTQ